MSAKLRFFFLGSLGLVVLAMSWLVFRGYQVNQEPVPEVTSKTASVAPVEKAESPKPAPSAVSAIKTAKSDTPTTAPATKAIDASPKKKEASKGTWITPSEITYLDQSPQQKMILDYLKAVGTFNTPPKAEPVFVGMNDQGLEQYEYDTYDSGHVVQWKRSGDTAVEQLEYPGGDKVTRRAPENDRPFAEVSYESKANGTFQSVNYRNNGTVESIQDTKGKTTTIYYYDEQGRLTDVYHYNEK
jgi:hypothetical protein